MAIYQMGIAQPLKQALNAPQIVDGVLAGPGRLFRGLPG